MSSQFRLVVLEGHILVRVNSDCPKIFFSCSLKQTISCTASRMIDDICALAVHIARNFLRLCSIGEIADKAADHLDIRIHIICALHITCQELLDAIHFHAADAADDARLRNRCCNNTCRIASFICCIGNCIDIIERIECCIRVVEVQELDIRIFFCDFKHIRLILEVAGDDDVIVGICSLTVSSIPAAGIRAHLDQVGFDSTAVLISQKRKSVVSSIEIRLITNIRKNQCNTCDITRCSAFCGRRSCRIR